MQYNIEFWNALDELVSNSEIVIDRPKGLLMTITTALLMK